MNKCKNCKYYIKDYDCKHYGTCWCYEKLCEEKNKKIENDKLFYMDSDWYNASVEVGENYGCVHFRKKETENEKQKN